MALSPLPVCDTRFFFRPLAAEVTTLLRALPQEAWHRPTIAGTWVVRDVVAHLVDTTIRRLSAHRDGYTPPPPPLTTDADFVAFINALNATWVAAARRVSPRMLTDLYAFASTHLAAFIESLALDATPLFPVSWAGEDASAGWFDIGREFTEQWHHQMQIRDAVGRPSNGDVAWLRAVLEIAVRGLPHAYRATSARPGATIALEITGAAGGTWTLRRDDERWSIWCGAVSGPTATIRISDDAGWRLLFNALRADDAATAVDAAGDRSLIEPFLRARSVIV